VNATNANGITFYGKRVAMTLRLTLPSWRGAGGFGLSEWQPFSTYFTSGRLLP